MMAATSFSPAPASVPGVPRDCARNARSAGAPAVPWRIGLKASRASRLAWMWLACLLLVPATAAGAQRFPPLRAPRPFPQRLKTPPKFGFEDGPMEWIVQTYKDSRACVRVAHSEEQARSGKGSLEVVMALVGGDASRSKGEVWINLKESSPKGVKLPVNLAGRTLTVWVLAPYGARGDRDRPNGFQLFVKDANWKSYYGSWKNVIEGQWVQLAISPGRAAPEGGYVDRGFDPAQINAIGVKMGSGDGSRAKFEGSIYVDHVDWSSR